MPTRKERIEGGLLGLLVGDALGVPYEFSPSSAIPPADRIEYIPPPSFHRAHGSVPPGTWSDDGAQALALLASLLESGSMDPEDFGRRLVAWHDEGFMAVEGRVFDCGIQTGRAIRALREGAPAEEAGPRDERDNGNGSLMRVLPLALWHTGADADLAEDACRQSRVSHGHERSQACCAIYCLSARRVLEGAADPWGSAASAMRGIFAAGSPVRRELEESIRPDEPHAGRGTGYVLDCLHSARQVIDEAGSFEEAVKAAVTLGNDTDTTAAVVGGIAGLKYGVGAIPWRWINGLRGRGLYEPLLLRLFAHRGELRYA